MSPRTSLVPRTAHGLRTLAAVLLLVGLLLVTGTGLARAAQATPAPATTSSAEPAPSSSTSEQSSDADAESGSLARTGGTDNLALAVTGLTFLGLGVIAFAVTADKRRKSPEG